MSAVGDLFGALETLTYEQIFKSSGNSNMNSNTYNGDDNNNNNELIRTRGKGRRKKKEEKKNGKIFFLFFVFYFLFLFLCKSFYTKKHHQTKLYTYLYFSISSSFFYVFIHPCSTIFTLLFVF